ncbi:hypothetical protein, partial [Sulfitobacter sp. CS16]|uniref:hypothetical protein n=1 Tax=Sulfitobacter sp. CS16 TaxID=3368573 RepID=UPI0037463C66
RQDAAEKAEALEAHNAELIAERDQALKKNMKEETAVTQLQAVQAERVMALRIQTRLQSSHLELQERFEALQTKYAIQQTLISTLLEQLEMIVPAPEAATKKALPSKSATGKTGANKK